MDFWGWILNLEIKRLTASSGYPNILALTNGFLGLDLES